MRPSIEIDNHLQEKYMSSVKRMHFVSHPVIRYQEYNGKKTYWLAAFAIFCTEEEMANLEVPRPKVYCLADIASGRIETSIDCRKMPNKDFSTASFGARNSISPEGTTKYTSGFAKELYARLDEARRILIEGNDGSFYLNAYNDYFNMLLSSIPDGLKRFYEELSLPETPGNRQKRISKEVSEARKKEKEKGFEESLKEPEKEIRKEEPESERSENKQIKKEEGSKGNRAESGSGRQQAEETKSIEKDESKKLKTNAASFYSGKSNNPLPSGKSSEIRSKKKQDEPPVSPEKKHEDEEARLSENEFQEPDDRNDEYDYATVHPGNSDDQNPFEQEKEAEKEESDSAGDEAVDGIAKEEPEKADEKPVQNKQTETDRDTAPANDGKETAEELNANAGRQAASQREKEDDTETEQLRANHTDTYVKDNKMVYIDDGLDATRLHPEHAQANEDESNEKVKTNYLYKEIRWMPNEDLSLLPEKYYCIIRRIAACIRFLPCDVEKIRYSYPLFCFREDSVSGSDPWQMMQLKVLNMEMPIGHFRISPGESIFISCKNRNRCLFSSCPYTMAAYYKYLAETNPEEIEKQREAYRKNKKKGQGDTVFGMRFPAKGISMKELEWAKKYVELGLYGIAKRAEGIYTLSLVTNGKGLPVSIKEMPEIHAVTSYTVNEDEYQNGLYNKGYICMLSGKELPKYAAYLALADALIRSGKYDAYVKSLVARENLPDEVIVTVSDEGLQEKQPRRLF